MLRDGTDVRLWSVVVLDDVLSNPLGWRGPLHDPAALERTERTKATDTPVPRELIRRLSATCRLVLGCRVPVSICPKPDLLG